MFQITLPYPPSVNHYWGARGVHRFLTAKAKAFRAATIEAVRTSGQGGFGEARLEVCIQLHAPDRRVRDIDNCVKSILDSLCHAGVFVDDSQVDRLVVERSAVVKGGSCLVHIKLK